MLKFFPNSLKFCSVYAHTEYTHNKQSLRPESSIKKIFVPGGPFDQAYSVFSKKFKIDDFRNLMSVYL